MELIRGHYNLKPKHYGCVATMGSFDGVHIGHQTLIQSTVDKARELQLPSLLISYEPLPREFFQPEQSPPRLTRFRERFQLLKQMGIDRFLCLSFDNKLANTDANDFIKHLLVDSLGIKHFIIGDDSQFGHKRQGNAALLETRGKEYGFTVSHTSTISNDELRISSTRIREALTKGDMQTAARLFGRHYHMSGRVAHGDKRGRDLGFPTANIHIKRRQSAIMGIFVVEVSGIADKPLPGVASVGIRPTFGGGACILEVHLLDFKANLYGQHLDIHFLHKLRDEEKYNSAEELVEAIEKDVQQTRQFFREFKGISM